MKTATLSREQTRILAKAARTVAAIEEERLNRAYTQVETRELQTVLHSVLCDPLPGLTDAELARVAGVPTEAVSNWRRRLAGARSARGSLADQKIRGRRSR